MLQYMWWFESAAHLYSFHYPLIIGLHQGFYESRNSCDQPPIEQQYENRNCYDDINATKEINRGIGVIDNRHNNI